ncbi:ABC transporter permease [Thalassobium sp. R2A62]|jgi:peptide/nickel transport system permease protein|uniref:ABC transporter permease n=1 Tax=Thalassobium sp. R2A62 TaxID=633131 RepID=UPI0001B1D02C|nr:ABC transporter permease [Thalassobium sp. R2A62]EET46767.1 oligopeptide transport system permease protein AppC [Thalassobium sp. R2A62]MDG1338985.1 ABC transporter permease [Paracoccaceae bacterium]MDG2453604.1 ABC transporter permease [Paracoccaceae bacterium]
MTDAAVAKPPRNQWWDVWDQFKSHRGALISAVIFIAIILIVLIGPMIWPYEPTKTDIRNKNMRHMLSCFGLDWGAIAGCLVNPTESGIKVSWWHPLGTDQLGRDLFARMMFGGRISMAVGVTAMLIALVLGTAVGVISGYFKRFDWALMRLTDLFLALPLLPLLLVMVMLFRAPLSATFGTEQGIFILMVTAIGITSWMPTARIVRADVLAIKEREFVLAARSIGTRPRKMIMRHLLPNVMSPIMVSATLGIANAIITESALSFLGLGFPPDFPTWGRLLNDGVQYMQAYPERVMWPGIFISVIVLCVNYVGDGLRDALDPRIRGL